MSYGSSIDLGKDLENEKKLKIKELDPAELTKKEKEDFEKKQKKKLKDLGSSSGKVRFKKYGGKGILSICANFIEKRHVAILLLICLISGFLILSQSAFMKGIEDNVEKNILANLEKQIQLKVDLDYPRVSKIERLRLAKSYFDEAVKGSTIKKQITTKTKEIQDYYKDPSGQTYIYGIDSYLFLTEARNLLEIGNTGYLIKDHEGTLWRGNILREAPKGVGSTNSFLSYIEYYSLKFTGFFGWSLEKTAFWLPLLFGLFSITLVFFIAKKITNPVGGFFSAFIFSIHQRFFTGNYVGFADTTYLNMFFSLLLIFLLIHFLDFRFKKSIACILLAIPATLLFKWSWYGYLFIYAVMVFFGFFYLLLFLVKDIQKNKYWLIGLGILLVLGSVSFKSTYFFWVLKRRLMPDMFTSSYRKGTENIIELKKASLETLFNATGGYLFWILVLVALSYIIYIYFKKGPKKFFILLLAWFIPTLIAGILSRRFLFYSAPSFSILIGLSLSLLFPALVMLTNSTHLNIRERTWKVVIVIILSLLLILSVKADISKLRDYYPPMNDAIYETSNFIRLNSDSNAVINTWWDLGYMYQYYARRGTFFDPGAFGGPRQYWVSTAFMNENPEEAKDIFKMQNCAKVKVAERDTSKIDLKEKGDCGNPGFIIISEDMLGKIYEMQASVKNREKVALSVLAKIGSKENVTRSLSTNFNLTKTQAEMKYQELINFKDIAEPVKISRLSSCVKNNDNILCDNGYKIQDNEVTYKGAHPDKFYSYLNNKKIEVNYEDSKSDFAFILYETGKGIYSFMIQSDLADIMIIRMFAGDKIKGFEEVYSTENPMQIRTYKIVNDNN